MAAFQTIKDQCVCHGCLFLFVFFLKVILGKVMLCIYWKGISRKLLEYNVTP